MDTAVATDENEPTEQKTDNPSIEASENLIEELSELGEQSKSIIGSAEHSKQTLETDEIPNETEFSTLFQGEEYVFQEEIEEKRSRQSDKRSLYENKSRMSSLSGEIKSYESLKIYESEKVRDLEGKFSYFSREDYYKGPHNRKKTIIFPSGNINFDSENNLVSSVQPKKEFRIDNYCDKILIIRKTDVEVVKKTIGSECQKRIVFVVDKSMAENIYDNELHLDDLQYKMAKALGIEPKHLKVSYFVKQLRTLRQGYTKFEIGKIIDSQYQVDDENLEEIEFIDVVVEDLENNKTNISVLIKNLTHGSFWLGGYKNSFTGVWYHNATTQTNPKEKWYGHSPGTKLPELCARDTQTHEPYKDADVNITLDHSTQMARPDLYIPADTDKIISPRGYRSFDCIEFNKTRVKAVTVIQKKWRSYLYRKYNVPKEDEICVYNRLINEAYAKNPAFHIKRINEDIFNKNMMKMIYPITNNDFFHLLSALNKQNVNNLKELQSIEHCYTKQSLSNVFLQRELELLKGIQQLRVSSKIDLSLIKSKKFWGELTTPELKQNVTKDNLYFIQKHETERFRELREIFLLFRREVQTEEERIEILMIFKQLLETYDEFEMKDHLIELIDRECILLSSGMESKHLTTLRKRAEEIALYFFKVLERKMTMSDTIPQNRDIYRCKVCRKFKSLTQFPIYVRQKFIYCCKSCLNRYNTSRDMVNRAAIRKLLTQIRKDEYSRGCPNPYVSILQSYDLEYIIDTIWGGQSIISKSKVDLRLPRWDGTYPWAPWNCILLTEDEARIHETIKNVSQFYSDEFWNVIRHKHLKALVEFSRLIYFENKSRKSWSSLPSTYSISQKKLMNEIDKAGDDFFNPPPRKKFTA